MELSKKERIERKENERMDGANEFVERQKTSVYVENFTNHEFTCGTADITFSFLFRLIIVLLRTHPPIYSQDTQQHQQQLLLS